MNKRLPHRSRPNYLYTRVSILVRVNRSHLRSTRRRLIFQSKAASVRICCDSLVAPYPRTNLIGSRQESRGFRSSNSRWPLEGGLPVLRCSSLGAIRFSRIDRPREIGIIPPLRDRDSPCPTRVIYRLETGNVTSTYVPFRGQIYFFESIAVNSLACYFNFTIPLLFYPWLIIPFRHLFRGIACFFSLEKLKHFLDRYYYYY